MRGRGTSAQAHQRSGSRVVVFQQTHNRGASTHPSQSAAAPASSSGGEPNSQNEANSKAVTSSGGRVSRSKNLAAAMNANAPKTGPEAVVPTEPLAARP